MVIVGVRASCCILVVCTLCDCIVGVVITVDVALNDLREQMIHNL